MSPLSRWRRLLFALPVKLLPVHWQRRLGPGAAYMPLESPSRSARSGAKVADKWRPRRRRALAALLVLALLALSLSLGLGLGLGLREGDSEQGGPLVDLGFANYTGTYLPNGVSQYLGMRYARPPTGNLRWRAPRPPEDEQNDQNAKEFGPICLGVSDSADESRDEDCLYANVWAPTNATAEMKLPVVVFIQGGGYTRLANYNWNASQIVETSDKNIVFVNFNYRVGLWGFLAGEEVRDNGDLNVGLLDQRFLLDWVQTHIHKFGGDPDHVVIHGISAGAGSVALHLAAYGGRNDNLFIGAMAESIFVPHHPPVADLEYQLNRTMEAGGCFASESEDRMDCLRRKDTGTLQSLNAAQAFPGRSTNALFYWTPCVDGDLLQDVPSALYSQDKFLHVPSLFGTCTNEGSVFPPSDTSTDEDMVTFFRDQHPGMTSSQVSDLLTNYPRPKTLIPNHASWFPSASLAYGESTFVCPTNAILNALARNTTSLYSYRYNVHDADLDARGVGVPHVTEAPAVFGPDMLTYTPPESYKTYNAQMVPLMMNYFISFARTLDPSTHKADGAPEWKTWGDGHRRLLLETGNSTMESVGVGEVERCRFWEEVGQSLYK